MVVEKTRKVPCVVETKVPDPPCHWHTAKHSHRVEVGKMHQHGENVVKVHS